MVYALPQGYVLVKDIGVPVSLILNENNTETNKHLTNILQFQAKTIA